MSKILDYLRILGIAFAIALVLRGISVVAGFDRYYIPVLDPTLGAIVDLMQALGRLGSRFFPHLQ